MYGGQNCRASGWLWLNSPQPIVEEPLTAAYEIEIHREVPVGVTASHLIASSGVRSASEP